MAVTIDVVCLLGVYSHDAYHQAGREPKCKLLFHANYLITAEKIIDNALSHEGSTYKLLKMIMLAHHASPMSTLQYSLRERFRPLPLLKLAAILQMQHSQN